MGGVLVGYAIIASIIGLGYFLGRSDLLGPHAPFVIRRVVYYVLSPCLLFTVVADADIHDLFTAHFVVSAAAAAISFVLYLLLAKLVLRRPGPEAIVGSLSASYVNAGNIGLPVAVYILGDATLSVPVLLFQIIVIAPIALTILDVQEKGRVSFLGVVKAPLSNPILIGSGLGLVLAITGLQLPDPVMEPFRLVGAATVPLVLMAFGISLGGERPLQPGTGRKDIVLATVIKTVIMPVAAFLLGRFVFGLSGAELFAIVVLAALPTAQNVFVYAQRYQRGTVIARDTALITTILSVPALVLIAALLSG